MADHIGQEEWHLIADLHADRNVELQAEICDLEETLATERKRTTDLQEQIDGLTGDAYMLVPQACAECGRWLSLSCSVHGDMPT